MVRSITTAGARLGIVTLAAIGAFAVPASIAAAAPAGTSVATDCDSLQTAVDGLKARIATLEEMLADAPPPMKPGIIAQLKKLNAQLADLEHQLATCSA